MSRLIATLQRERAALQASMAPKLKTIEEHQDYINKLKSEIAPVQAEVQEMDAVIGTLKKNAQKRAAESLLTTAATETAKLFMGDKKQ